MEKNRDTPLLYIGAEGADHPLAFLFMLVAHAGREGANHGHAVIAVNVDAHVAADDGVNTNCDVRDAYPGKISASPEIQSPNPKSAGRTDSSAGELQGNKNANRGMPGGRLDSGFLSSWLPDSI